MQFVENRKLYQRYIEIDWWIANKVAYESWCNDSCRSTRLGLVYHLR